LKALEPVTEAGKGVAVEDEQKKLGEIVQRMNDLFSGDLSEADLVGYVTTINGKLMESQKLQEQAANNSEEQFALGDFKDVLTDIVIEGQENHNRIADQLLKDERIFAAMQGMMASMVYRAMKGRDARI
jgi:type I restriction enzyme R subunit